MQKLQTNKAHLDTVYLQLKCYQNIYILSDNDVASDQVMIDDPEENVDDRQDGHNYKIRPDSPKHQLHKSKHHFQLCFTASTIGMLEIMERQ